MGAATFSLSKKNRARKARADGKFKEAEVLDKSAAKFRPKNTEPLESESKDAAEIAAENQALIDAFDTDADLVDATEPEEVEVASDTEPDKVEVDLDGDGVADVVISKK